MDDVVIAGILSDDPSIQLESITEVGRIVALDFPPMQRIVESGVLVRVIDFLTKEDFPNLQYEAACVIVNIAFVNPDMVVAHGAVPILVNLIGSPLNDVSETAICALGNIAHNPLFRDILLHSDVLMPLLAQMNENSSLSMLRIASWTLTMFCRSRPNPPFDQVRAALPVLARLVQSNDEIVLKNACMALSCLSDGGEEEIQCVIDAGVVPRLVYLLLHLSQQVSRLALLTLGNIVSGNTQQTQCVINHGFLINMMPHLYDTETKPTTLWMISNITAGTEEQIQEVIEKHLIPVLVNMAQHVEYDTKKEAVWAISNAILCGSHDQIKYVLDQNCLKPLCDMMVNADNETIVMCLDGLERILEVGEAEKNAGDDVNYYCQMIEDVNGLNILEDLQDHPNADVYNKAFKVLETYWQEDNQPPQS